MVRYEGKKLAGWLDRFQRPVTRLEVAKGQRTTDETELKQLWKGIFAGNISSAEHAITARDMVALKLNPSANFGEEEHGVV